MTDKPIYYYLVDVIKHLQRYGHDAEAKVCVKALYDLERKDKIISELRKEVDVWRNEAFKNFNCAQEA